MSKMMGVGRHVAWGVVLTLVFFLGLEAYSANQELAKVQAERDNAQEAVDGLQSMIVDLINQPRDLHGMSFDLQNVADIVGGRGERENTKCLAGDTEACARRDEYRAKVPALSEASAVLLGLESRMLLPTDPFE